MPRTIQMGALQSLGQFAMGLGASIEEVREILGVAVGDMRPEVRDARAPVHVAQRLWRLLEQHAPRQSIGLLAAQGFAFTNFGVIGLLAQYVPTVGDFIVLGARYHRLLDSALQLEVREDGERVVIALPPDDVLDEMRHPAELALAMTFELMRRAAGAQDGWLHEARFRHVAPGPVKTYASFFDAPVRFESTESCLICRADVLELVNASADPTVTEYLRRTADDLLEALDDVEAGIVDRARTAIREGLRGGDVSLTRAAKRLGLSTRSLQRELSRVGTSFRELLDDARHEASLRLLDDPRLSLGEVSFLLGFNDTSSFFRAFKRWTGTTPASARSSRD